LFPIDNDAVYYLIKCKRIDLVESGKRHTIRGTITKEKSSSSPDIVLAFIHENDCDEKSPLNNSNDLQKHQITNRPTAVKKASAAAVISLHDQELVVVPKKKVVKALESAPVSARLVDIPEDFCARGLPRTWRRSRRGLESNQKCNDRSRSLPTTNGLELPFGRYAY
jgi:hypothetical protein